MNIIPLNIIQYDYIKNEYNLNVKFYKFEENPLEKICSDYNLKYEHIHRLKTNYPSDSFGTIMIGRQNILYLNCVKKILNTLIIRRNKMKIEIHYCTS